MTGSPLSGGPLRSVESYLFRPGTFDRLGTAHIVEVEALEWWDGSYIWIDGRKFCNVDVDEWFEILGLIEPFAEVLSCGHSQAVRRSRRAKGRYYARRRRCLRCALEAMAA